MKTVTLSPVTKKGSNILDNHGEVWEVFKQKDQVVFSQMHGPWLLISPVGSTTAVKDARWVHLIYDKNFIVKLHEDM